MEQFSRSYGRAFDTVHVVNQALHWLHVLSTELNCLPKEDKFRVASR